MPQNTAAEHAASCSSGLLMRGFSRDATLRAACLSEVMQAQGTADCMPQFWPPNPNSACSRLLAEPAGPVPTGQLCGNFGDCQGTPGLFAECAVGPDLNYYCDSVSPGKEGDTCIASINEFFYEPVLTTVKSGHYCSSVDGLLCRPRDASSPDVDYCVTQFADGSVCYHSYECLSGECLPPPVGSPDGTCATHADPHDLADGASCSSDQNCRSHHCTNSQCQSVVQYAGYETFCRWY
jgi:hypothetical protein